MRVLSISLVLFLFCPGLWAAPFKLHKEYCSALAKCGVAYNKKFCPDSLCGGIKGVSYDSIRCHDVLRLSKVRIPYSRQLRRKVFGFLGYKYRVEYNISDTLPVKIYQFEYLLKNLPLAAKLINVFRETDYHVEYKSKNKRYWKGKKGKNLYGEAILLTGGIPKKSLTYFGFGVVKILKWKITGPGLIEFNYTSSDDNTITYDMRVIAVPGNKLLDFIMNMGLFRKLVISKIVEVFEDITASANSFNQTPLDVLLSGYTWTKREREQLQVLFNTPE